MQDGNVPREEEYAIRKRYMMRRCRYAAALLENINNPHGAAIQDANQMMHIVEDWSDQRLEAFFLQLVEAFHNVSLLVFGLCCIIKHSPSLFCSFSFNLYKNPTAKYLQSFTHSHMYKLTKYPNHSISIPLNKTLTKP